MLITYWCICGCNLCCAGCDLSICHRNIHTARREVPHKKGFGVYICLVYIFILLLYVCSILSVYITKYDSLNKPRDLAEYQRTLGIKGGA